MQLVGMLDSPYVRRVAVTLRLLGLPFEHRSLSVFRGFEQFRLVNPVVKAPTLVCDKGTLLMDSTLMIDYAEALAAARAGPARSSLMPAGIDARRRELRLLGLALAACEKAVQIVYEHGVRPAEKVHQPWLERVTGQMHAAFGALEAEQAGQPMAATPEAIGQAGVTTAVVWFFTEALLPGVLEANRYPALRALSAQAEQLDAFQAAPHGEGTVRGAEPVAAAGA